MYTFTYEGGHVVVVCRTCGQEFRLKVSEDQIRRWRGGALIQSVMPNLTAAERELLISGTCGACFDKLFPPSEEDE